jgi:hypothetical protein
VFSYQAIVQGEQNICKIRFIIKRRKAAMDYKNLHRVLFLILYVVTLAIYGCTGTIPGTVSSTLPALKSTPSPRPTTTKISTPDDLATAHFIETASINSIMSTVQAEVLASYPSSDRKWRVDFIRYNCMDYRYQDYFGSIAYEQLKLVNLSSGTEKIVKDILLNCDGVGAFGLEGLYYSPSNRFFYYSDWREGTPDGGCGNYLSLPIYRLDTLTQEIITVGGSHISPDRTKLAMWEGKEIVIWDLDKGEIDRIQGIVPNFVNGAIAWSPDNRALVYLQSTFDCAPDYGMTYVTRLDLAGMSQTLLLKFQPPGFGDVSWDVPNQITLMDGDGKFWTYNLITKETIFLGDSLFTPTPVPLGVFALYFYSPLVMNYDSSIWEDKNGLQVKNLASCTINEQGPTDFNGPHSIDLVRLGEINYTVLTFPDAPPDFVSWAYLADKSLATESGLPVFWVGAKPNEWSECKTLAEKVLSTLHIP